MFNDPGRCRRALLVLLFIFSLTIGIVSNSITSAQIEPEEPILIGDDPGTGGSGGGCTWRCPVGSITISGAAGNGSCTSVGCKKSSSNPDSYWVCAFRASGQGVTCPLWNSAIATELERGKGLNEGLTTGH